MSDIKTLPNGVVTIDGETPLLEGQALVILKENVVGRWLGPARSAAMLHSIPLTLLLSIVFAESQGNEKAVSNDGGFGLGRLGRNVPSTTGQLTSSAARDGLSNEELLDGPTNLRATAKYLAKIRGDQDLPHTAAAYNAGSAKPSTKNRWGLASSPGYLDRVVGANNSIITLGLAPSVGGSVGTRRENLGWGTILIAGVAYVGYRIAKAA